MATQKIKLVNKVFKEVADTVTPTMGAKGRMAVINDEFGRPILTDDGVTVAKNLRDSYKDFERMIAISMIEAASNTERSAYDGTTLTILLTNELYKLGLSWIRKGMHPQTAADKIQALIADTRHMLDNFRIRVDTPELISNIAYITTKIPVIGQLVAEAYKTAGGDMNILIEHDRVNLESSIEHVDGMVLDAGYFSEVMQKLCNDNDKTVFKNAHIALLQEGMMTSTQCRSFFMSIPEDKRQEPFVFIIPASFNPESLRMLTDTLINNKFKFQFVFINDNSSLELFLDLEAKTNGLMQDASRGTSDYEYTHCGFVESITIELDKTTIINTLSNGVKLQERINKYKKEWEENKFTTSMVRQAMITRRLANITAGITTIKIACPTVTEYVTIKLKLDDAIGAVKCAIRDGAVLGCGKTLYVLGDTIPELKRPLSAPLLTICKNAGVKVDHKYLKSEYHNGYNVIHNKQIDLLQEGIIDSYTSVDAALYNASSIASQYLRAFVLINK